MRKFKFFIDFDKEEKWLEEMAQQGWQLENRTVGYQFRQTQPEDTVIRIDYRKFKTQEDFVDYCTLFEDSGWKHLAGSKNSGSQYFKKMHKDSEEDIFSDRQSNAAKYKKLSEMFVQLAICYLPLFAAFISTDVIHSAAFFNPKLLYLTQELWEMSGIDFWKAFLFETPFALFRLILWLFLPIMIVLSLVFASKAQRLFKINS
jgi:Protein of unknown function (DUF2812)